ncbi:hypothetical protein NU195Hw_g4113t1 [Hortaea werneckii]
MAKKTIGYTKMMSAKKTTRAEKMMSVVTDGPQAENNVDSTSEAHITRQDLRQRKDRPSYVDMDAGEA